MGTVPFVRVVRAVRGVGALIIDFFGVSVTLLVREAKFEVEVSNAFAVPGVGLAILARRPAVMKGCRNAAWGFTRRSGSQTRHFEMKSMNSSSSHRKTWARLLEPGLRLFPLELTTGRGAPVVSKKSLLRELRLTKSLSGTPRTSMIQESCSCSFSPGKIGNPV